MAFPGETEPREQVDLDRALIKAEVAREMFGESSHPVRLGRFEIERRLGHGAMGVVYEARDVERGAVVALKSLSRLDARAIYRLKREFRSLADVVHPNLVALHELCCEDGRWFFTMERVQGMPFDRWVRPTNTRFDEERLRSALRQLALGVSAIHRAGKLHRDLKPSNVLVTGEGRVVILDFGLVCDADEQAQSQQSGLAGTPAYMAPELAAGEGPDAASDWYAVGVMLFEALTGRLPFDGKALRLLGDKQERDAPAPRDIRPDVPDDLDEFCAGLLRRSPQARFDGSALTRSLGQSAQSTLLAGASPSLSFVGRMTELQAMTAAFAAVRDGGPCTTMLIRGRSGIGKSALLDRFGTMVGEDALVLRGRCHVQESMPYKAFDSVVDALSRHLRDMREDEVMRFVPRHASALVKLFPVLGQVRAFSENVRERNSECDARELRAQAFGALKELLLRLTDRIPVLIVVDDLQWGDADSAQMLAHLVGAPEPPPLMFLGAYRAEDFEHSEFLQRVFEGQLPSSDISPRVLELNPLPMQDATELSRALLAGHDADPATAMNVAVEAEGVPGFISELAQYFAEGKTIGWGQGGARAISLSKMMLARISELPDETQRLLRVLCVAAGPVELAVACDAAGLGQAERAPMMTLRALRLGRILAGAKSGSVETYHDRVRETVLSAMDPAALKRTHLALAVAMEAHGVVEPERLIAHHLGAGNAASATELAARAGHLASTKLAFNRAAEMYQKALDLLAPDDPSCSEVHQALGDALANAGRGAQAADAYLRAADGLERSAARKLQCLAARQYMRSGRIELGTYWAKRLFESVGLSFPEKRWQAVAAYAWNSALLSLPHPGSDGKTASGEDIERLTTLEALYREFGIFDMVRGAAFQVQFVRRARSAGDSARLLDGMASQAWSAAAMGRKPAVALQIVAEVEALAHQIGTPRATATSLGARAACALMQGRVGEVLVPAAEAERIYRDSCPGSDWEQSLTAVYRYCAIEHVGGFKTVLREAPVRVREALEKDDWFSASFMTLFVTFAYLIQDQPEQAEEFLEQQRARLLPEYSSFHLWVAVRATHLLLYRDSGQSTLAYIEQEMRRFAASAMSRGGFLMSSMNYLMARGCLAAAKHNPRERLSLLRRAEQCARSLKQCGQPQAQGLALLVLAETAWRRGQEEQARSLLSTCIAGTSTHQAPMFATYARRALGSVLGGTEGAALISAVDTELREEGVQAPEHWIRIWIDMELV